MFQYIDNDVNSYNSLSMNQTRKTKFSSPKTYLSTKIKLSNEFSSTIQKNKINNNKNKNIILNLNNPNISTLKTDREDSKNNLIDNNINRNEKNDTFQTKLKRNLNLNEKNKTNISLTKLPKIAKYSIRTNSDTYSVYNNINTMKSISNSIDKIINPNINIYYAKNQVLYNDHSNSKSSNIKRKNSLRLSGKVIFESIHSNLNEMQYQNINNNIICNNINNDINNNIIINNSNSYKKIKMKNEPKLGKMKEYIILPDFIGEEPLTEMIFNPMFEENLMKPHNEKQYEINFYLNSNKMLNNLIYLKIPIGKDGLISTQNIVNVKKLNKENKLDEDEEDILIDNKNELEKNELTKNEITKNEKPIQEETTQLIISKNTEYDSISSYPGNYRPKKEKKEKELKLSQNIIINQSNRLDYKDMAESKNDKVPNNLKLHRIVSRNKNNNEIFLENNIERYISKSINNQMGKIFYNSAIDKTYSSINNNDDLVNANQDNKEEIFLTNTFYGGIEPYYKIKNENDKTLIFESRFESGNLLCAFKTEEENKYILYLQNDTNTTGYIQWFFFRVTNTKKGNKATFTIINMLRKTCVYKKGLKIMTYSKMQAKEENIGWHRDCDNVMYYTNNLFTYNDNSKKKRSLSSLTFEYEFKYDNDTVYFANCLPYFYSKLTKEINFFEKRKNNDNLFFFKKSITQTLGGNDLILLNISSSKSHGEISFPQLNISGNQPFGNSPNSFKSKSNESNNQSKLNNSKKSVIMIARQHPGETVGSHVIKGCIDFLLGNSEEAQKLREIYNFQIIPMMNPDGVLVGNSRTGFAGCDLNRRWSKPNEIIHPEIFYTKSLILKTALYQNISFIIDFHGHFGAFNSLFYCNHKEQKEICSLFPYLCSKLSNIISFEQSTFSMPKYKYSTERLSLFRELEGNDNNNIVALETSFFGTKNSRNNEKNYYFNSKLLNEIGRDVCLGMLSYYIKYEKISIENISFLSDKENIKKLDVDMREFESELIREVNEDENQEGEDELSESEPSIDNFDKKEIMRLMPIPQKKKKRKGKIANNINHTNHTNNFRLRKFEKFSTKRKNGMDKNNLEKYKNTLDDDFELYNPLKELRIKKMEEENNKKLTTTKNSSPNTKSPINTLNYNQKSKTSLELKKNQHQSMNLPAPSPTEPNTKNNYSQTEEIFFTMHWSYFVGKYRILTGMKANNNLPNISSYPLNLLGQLNNNYINNFSYQNNKRKDLLIHGTIKNINWTRFKNVLINAKKFNPNKNINDNSNSKMKKSNASDNKSRISSLKDKPNLKNIYHTKFNGTYFSLKKSNNNELKGINKELLSKEKNK